jgi:LmbE family N-acetylglucosaminyl deacetylase
MLPIRLAEGDGPPTFLFLGAHADDIEIGCGATILRLLAEHPDAAVKWVVFSADDRRENEARASASAFLDGAGIAPDDIVVHRFRESYFPHDGAEVKDAFEDLKSAVTPDVVFTHRREDLHQDHRTIAELTWNTFRDHIVLEYEIPKFEGDLGHPNLFVPLTDEIVERKIDLLIEHFGTQRSKRWFRPATFRGLMALRGVESGAQSGWAEAFHARKLVL